MPTIDMLRTGIPVLVEDSVPKHNIRMNQNDEPIIEVDSVSTAEWDTEPGQPPDSGYNDSRKERFGNKFKPTKAHKRKIKKLATKAKQKQRRLK